MPLYTGIGSVRREVTELFCGVSGIRRKLTEMWAGIRGVDRKIFSSAEPCTITISFSTNSSTTSRVEAIYDGTTYVGTDSWTISGTTGTPLMLRLYRSRIIASGEDGRIRVNGETVATLSGVGTREYEYILTGYTRVTGDGYDLYISVESG